MDAVHPIRPRELLETITDNNKRTIIETHFKTIGIDLDRVYTLQQLLDIQDLKILDSIGDAETAVYTTITCDEIPLVASEVRHCSQCGVKVWVAANRIFIADTMMIACHKCVAGMIETEANG